MERNIFYTVHCAVYSPLELTLKSEARMEDLVTITPVPTTNVNGEMVELGKSLMNAARAGDVANVVRLVRFGAPFATDWVSVVFEI